MSILAGRWIKRRVLSLCFVAGMGIAGPVAAAEQPAGTPGQPHDLLQAWLSFPDATTVQWPYAFITPRSAANDQEKLRAGLDQEFDRLHWRLVSFGYPKLAETVAAWRERIKQIRLYRVPGDWSPAFLLSHPNRQPPIDQISAIGACEVPTTVGVWSAAGYQDIPWQSGMRVSSLEKQVPALRKGSEPYISVVDPYGNIDRYGVKAWNYGDGYVAPGSQVVASLPLKGSAFEWIRDSIAGVLAHTPSGVNCRRVQINGETASDDSGS